MSLKNRLYNLLNENDKNTKASKSFNTFIITLILLNTFAIILESFAEIRNNYGVYFSYFEIFSVIIFSLEYIGRLYTSSIKYHSDNIFKSVIRYIISPLAIIDLLAILPAYLPFLIVIDLRFLRMIRVLRIARLFKINRYSKSLNLISEVLKEKKIDLGITIFVTFIVLIIASALMYSIESRVQPDKFQNIVSTFWWAIATLTTVGYGDVYPITGLGKFISGIIALLGIGLVALPTGIISSAFIEKINVRKGNDRKCPTCGQSIKE
ncbi:ion transporter [Marivirga harenae]|uniref:ion transporter n=1 Tax=Marivirga harenae TaxID=2010992 RepID=UPI0026DECC28|nr:ion transporter [Marivirga harenae]WKV11463.1 ion transporter [Marivirga harenae]